MMINLPAVNRPPEQSPRRAPARMARSPLGRGAAATGHDAAAPPPPFLANPAIAQRELLRQFYLTPCAGQQVQLVQAAAEAVDVHTGLHLLCYTAEQSMQGQLQGGAAERNALLHAIYATMENSVPQLEPQQLGALVWSLASMQGCQMAWTEALFDGVAVRELERGAIARYNTKELSSILYAAGKLCGRPPSAAAKDYAAALAAELVRRLEQLPYVKGSLSIGDYTDVAESCAAIYGTEGSALGVPGNGEEPGRDPGGPVPSAVLQLLDAGAGEVRRQLANKHSLCSPFPPRDLVPRDLIRFLGAYVRLGHRTDDTSGMLDAVAGLVVSRVRSRHLNAVARPEDLAAVLAAFADLRHRTVAVPELLGAVGEQLRRNAAQQAERELAGAAGAGAPDAVLSLPAAAQLLRCHWRLGFRPEEATLHAMVPGMWRQLAASRPADVAQLLALLAEVGYSPGSRVLSLMLARIGEEEESEEDEEDVSSDERGSDDRSSGGGSGGSGVQNAAPGGDQGRRDARRRKARRVVEAEAHAAQLGYRGGG